jgi:predicted metalloprotease with PDZ domain
MSGALWFAEGFTSYYTNLTLVRAGIISAQEYAEGLAGGINYVSNSPGRNYHNPIEMSYQAPFVDAARSVDPTNRENTFISYYTYGSVLGLALDLSLRNEANNLSLDEFMRVVWDRYGKDEIPYTIRDIWDLLSNYAGEEFSNDFFTRYIYDSELPDYQRLLETAGVRFEKANPDKAVLGTSIAIENGVGKLRTNAIVGSPVYEAGINRNDEIVSIDGVSLSDVESVDEILSNSKPGDRVEIRFTRMGEPFTADVELVEDPTIQTELNQSSSSAQLQRRGSWLMIN